MSLISKCLTIAIAVATVVVSSLDSKDKNPFDLDF